MSLRQYREYKKSGATWLECVPNGWKVSPLKHLAEFVNGCVFKPDSWSESGVPIIRIENLNGSLNLISVTARLMNGITCRRTTFFSGGREIEEHRSARLNGRQPDFIF